MIRGIHAQANGMTKLCHGREQDSAGWEAFQCLIDRGKKLYS